MNKKNAKVEVPEYLSYNLTEPGEYVVIYYPQTKHNDNLVCGFICRNSTNIIYVIIGCIVGSIILAIICYKAVLMFTKLSESKMREKKY